MKEWAERIPGTVFYTEQHSKTARAMRLWGLGGSLSDESAEAATHQKMERVCVVCLFVFLPLRVVKSHGITWLRSN